MPQTRIGGSTAQSSGDGSTPRTNTSDGDGSTPRTDTSDGSTPRTASDGNAPRTTTSDGNGPRAASDGSTPRTKHDTPLSDNPSPGAFSMPNKELSEAEQATVARKARLRWEAETRTSAAEEVRVRNSKQDVRVTTSDKRDAEKLSKATMRGHERNAQRLKTADASDAAIIGESRLEGSRCFEEEENSFLPSDPNLFFPDPIVGPDDAFDPPRWFLEAVRSISQHKTRTPSKSPVRFESGTEAADHNAELLSGFGYDLGSLVRAYEDTTLGFGSEFRTVNELRPLLGNHCHFERLAELLTNGMDYVFTRELSELERGSEVKAMLARGNHKSAQADQVQVGRLIAKDVLHGFTIPIPVGVVTSIPGAMVQPLGLVQQWTVDADGNRMIKYRLTQDLSFSTDKTAVPVSINSRFNMSSYPEMVYGWCLPRIMHYVISLR